MYSVCVMSVASVSSLISWHPAKKEPTLDEPAILRNVYYYAAEGAIYVYDGFISL